MCMHGWSACLKKCKQASTSRVQPEVTHSHSCICGAWVLLQGVSKSVAHAGLEDMGCLCRQGCRQACVAAAHVHAWADLQKSFIRVPMCWLPEEVKASSTLIILVQYA